MASEFPIRNPLSPLYRDSAFPQGDFHGTGHWPRALEWSRRKLRDRVTFLQGLNISVSHRVCRIRELDAAEKRRKPQMGFLRLKRGVVLFTVRKLVVNITTFGASARSQMCL